MTQFHTLATLTQEPARTALLGLGMNRPDLVVGRFSLRSKCSDFVGIVDVLLP